MSKLHLPQCLPPLGLTADNGITPQSREERGKLAAAAAGKNKKKKCGCLEIRREALAVYSSVTYGRVQAEL